MTGNKFGALAIGNNGEDTVEIAIRIPEKILRPMSPRLRELFFAGFMPHLEHEAKLMAGIIEAMLSMGNAEKSVQVMDELDKNLRQTVAFALKLHSS